MKFEDKKYIKPITKNIGEHSFVSLDNTYVNRTDDDYVANVTGTQFRFANKKNSYAVQWDAAISQ